MNSSPFNTTSRQAQQGLGLISAIFVITVLALLAAGMAGITASSAKQHSQHILTIRAQSAAQSGLEILQVSWRSTNNCPKEETIITYDTPGLFDCQATISCSVIPQQTTRFITLKSQGTCGSGFDSASRLLEKRVLDKR